MAGNTDRRTGATLNTACTVGTSGAQDACCQFMAGQESGIAPLRVEVASDSRTQPSPARW